MSGDGGETEWVESNSSRFSYSALLSRRRHGLSVRYNYLFAGAAEEEDCERYTLLCKLYRVYLKCNPRSSSSLTLYVCGK